SLGSVLYAIVSGRPPFRAGNSLAVLKRVVEDTPRPIREVIPEVPPWLCDVIARLHAKDPNQRYQTAAEVAEVLVRGPDVPAPPAPPAPPARPRPRWPRRVALTAALVSALGAVIWGASLLFPPWGTERAGDPDHPGPTAKAGPTTAEGLATLPCAADAL